MERVARAVREERRFEDVDCVLLEAGRIPSKPRKRLVEGACVSLRIMRRRRPGAGRHGIVDGGSLCEISAACLRYRWCAQLDFKRYDTIENILLKCVSD